MAKKVKTNAMRILDRNRVEYESFQYFAEDENIDGTMVSRMNNRDVTLIHRTRS